MDKEKLRNFKTALPYYLAGAAFCGLMIWCLMELINQFIITPNKIRKIKTKPVIQNGAIIKEIQPINKVSGVYLFTYTYYAEGKTLLNKHSIGIEFKSRNSSIDLIQHSLPVVFESGNAKNSRLLITPKDFENFEIPFPDTLLWIKEDVID